MSTHECNCAWAVEPHGTWGDCLRSKNIAVSAVLNPDKQAEYGAWDANLAGYAQARSEGLQPAQVTPAAVKEAYALAE